MKVSSKKNKGRRLQQWVCEQISRLTGLPWGKDEYISSREMGQAGCDVRLVGKAKRVFPWAVECKNCERWDVHTWIKQAQNNQGELNWLLVIKKNRSRPVIICDAEVFFNECAKHTRKG